MQRNPFVHRIARFSIAAGLLASSCREPVAPVHEQPGPGEKSCQTASVPAVGNVAVLPGSAETDLCIRVPAGSDRYFVAFADTRDIERSRTGPGGAQKDDDFNMIVRGVKRTGIVRGERSVITESDVAHQRPVLINQLADDYCTLNAVSVLCRQTRWELDDRFADSRGLKYVVFGIEGPLVLALEEKQFESSNAAARQMYVQMAQRIVAVYLPLQETVFGSPLPPTSTAAPQTLILLGGNVGTHAIIVTDGMTVRGFVEAGFSNADREPYWTFYIYGHELTHLAQFKWAWELDPVRRKNANAEQRGYWGMPFWASEGGADFISCEAVRVEAEVTWGANTVVDRDIEVTASRMHSICLSDGSGDVGHGYSSASKFMRTVAEQMVIRGVPIEKARAEVARGTLEGWFGFDDAGLRFTGLTQRVSSLSNVPFDPAVALLSGAMRTALDDVDPGSEWNITSTRDAWRYWGYHAAFTASADTAGVKVFGVADGSGYLMIDAETVARDVRISVPFIGMRWMIARRKR